MKLLTLILMLATGELKAATRPMKKPAIALQSRVTMPAWECHAINADIERGWLGVECVTPGFLDLITLSSEGNCEDGV